MHKNPPKRAEKLKYHSIHNNVGTKVLFSNTRVASNGFSFQIIYQYRNVSFKSCKDTFFKSLAGNLLYLKNYTKNIVVEKNVPLICL